ncbi:MAG TPA: sigma-70 family RNA polymerase sigma factor [Vicinamibacteria bacterium]|nr:sigma-70 family RNA polymerase sigma factor [Vicinamibacteria bacterium]
MAPAGDASPERSILRARARGEVSADSSFEELYQLYGPTVRGWLRVRVPGPAADDLMQDVWLIFHGRWRRWEFRPEMEAEAARPVLSFLFRTCHFVLRGHRRRSGREESVEGVEAVDEGGAERLMREVEGGRALGLARRLCPEEELDVLLPKLAGVPAREIARTLAISEPVVDHRFRNALARIRKSLGRAPKGGKRGH